MRFATAARPAVVDRARRRVLTAGLAAVVAGCGLGVPRMQPGVPAEATLRAAPAGYTQIRSFGLLAGDAAFLADDALGRAALARLAGPEPVDLLALSGGGDGGAFGAGVLKGWTGRGDRPEFDYVTGVSTGAMIAPLAFLGPSYDDLLRTFYTGTTVADVLLLRPWQLLTGGPAAGDSAPLRARIDAIVTPEMVDAIAAERRKGRLLLIGTTNLDAQRQVIWDIGRIAASSQPDRVRLIRQILLASASIPAAFPPVLIDVQADGRRFQEMHVDGGVTRGVFAYPADLRLPPANGPRRMWVIRNSKLAPEPEAVPANALSIAGRSVGTMIMAQSRDDIAEMRRQAQRDGFDFNVTAVPAALPPAPDMPFDPAYMRTLYRAGLATGGSASGWAGDVTPLLAASTVATRGAP